MFKKIIVLIDYALFINNCLSYIFLYKKQVATLPGNLGKHEKSGIRDILKKKTGKTRNFQQIFFNKFYMLSSKIMI